MATSTSQKFGGNSELDDYSSFNIDHVTKVTASLKT